MMGDVMHCEYFRGCCNFDTFLNSLCSAARKTKFPLLLVDRLQARKHWRKGMTGYEALITQRNQQMSGIYKINDVLNDEG